MSFFDNPLFTAAIAVVPSFVLGYLAYRRSIKVDKVAEQSDIASSNTGAVAQVIAGLNSVIANLQADNKLLRQNIVELSVKLEKVQLGQDDLKREVDALKKRYGIV